MNSQRDALLQQRQALLQQMHAIDRLRRGTLSRQFFKAAPAGSARQGPYYVLQSFFHGQKTSQRIPPEQAAQVQAEVDNYRRFQALAEEFVTVSDQLTRLPAAPAAEKKTPAPGRPP